MEHNGYKFVDVLKQSKGKTLIAQLDQIEAKYPEFFAAFNLIALSICADVMADKSNGRGNILTDLGTGISAVILKGAQHVIPNKQIARSIAEKVNVSLEMQAIKNYLRKHEAEASAQIELSEI